MGSYKGLISVIIPVYNERKYLNACVESILHQTYQNIELILVDDGSNNGAEKDCDELAKSSNRVKVIHKKNEGLSAARITGLKVSRGDWVIFVDDDDVVSPDILQILTGEINDEIDVISGCRFDTNNPGGYQWTRHSFRDVVIENGVDLVEMIPNDKQQLYISTPLWGKIYRKSFLLSLNLEEYKTICPTIFFEDVLMTPIIYSKARKICIVKEIVYLHREVQTSISRSGKLSSFYFEQIHSGDILLQYAQSHYMPHYYHYFLVNYIKSILRIYCLMVNYISQDKADYYKKLIMEKERKYRWDFYTKGRTSYVNVIACLLFDIHPVLLKLFYRINEHITLK